LILPLAAVAIAAVVGATASAATPRGPTPNTTSLTKSSRSFQRDVRTLPQLGRRSKPDRPEREEPTTPLVGGTSAAPIGSGTTPIELSAPAPAPITSFEGLHFSENCGGPQCGAGHPPDTNGDVGPTYYVETINTAVGIYDKTTGARVAAFTFDALMSQGSFGNLCDTDNFGDPVVVYDTYADRWIITDFAFQLDAQGNIVNPPGAFQCFAVSKSGDPVSGGWNFYSMAVAGGLDDYPKFGIWPDGLYMSANMFGYPANAPFQNVRVWAFNKAQMYAGDPTVQAVSFNAPSTIQGVFVFSLLPSNSRLQVGVPPVGTPNYFSSIWGWTDRVRVWKFHVDWANPGASTFTGPTDSSTGSTWGSPPATVPEKDGNTVDSLGPRAMMQNQYTRIGGVESLWNTHAVLGSTASQAAVRWYQIPVTGGSISSATQASTWNPDPSSRFIPSLAVDRGGNMALGYSVSSATMYPAIRYAGRLASDPLNTLGQTEQSLIEGTGAQTPSHRWGDYSAMTLDPDGCTFWYTNEYYVTNGGDYHTRIGSFRYPAQNCVVPPGQPFILGTGNTAASTTSLDSSASSRGLSIQDGVPSAFAIFGDSSATSGAGTGVYGRSASSGANATGVSGEVTNGTGSYSAGVKGVNDASGFGGFGVFGRHAGQGIGVYGEAENGFAVSGFSPNNWSGYFQGSVNVVGTLFKSSGAFRIDNPIDPAHSYLQHSFVESPDMMNVYNGNVVTNSQGFATVRLPAWFQALNKDFRYQLTVLGRSFARAIVWNEIARNRFTIRTNEPRVPVSWQVTGIRHDAWAKTHRIQVLVPKEGSADGRYVHPELYGKPMTKSVVVLPGMRRAKQGELSTPALPKQP
jgi:hypothetical protein